jgi:cation transport protein ChaC
MPTGVYDPRWLRCRTASGDVTALGFTLSRRSPNFTGRLSDDEMLQILAHARGRYGSTLDYLLHTVEALRKHRMVDRESERLLRLAYQRGLA